VTIHLQTSSSRVLASVFVPAGSVYGGGLYLVDWAARQPTDGDEPVAVVAQLIVDRCDHFSLDVGRLSKGAGDLL